MYDITGKMIFDIPFMISRESFEIRTVHLRKRPSWKLCMSDNHAVFNRTTFSSRLCDYTLKWIFFSFHSIIKLFVDVEDKLENNILFIFHDFEKKL